MKKLFTLTCSILICIITSATLHTNPDADYEYAKGFALCSCMQYLNNDVDSTSKITNDVSISYFVEYSSLDIYQMFEIKNFVDSLSNEYIAIPKQTNGNMNSYTCWRVYESNELDLFIRKLLRK